MKAPGSRVNQTIQENSRFRMIAIDPRTPPDNPHNIMKTP